METLAILFEGIQRKAMQDRMTNPVLRFQDIYNPVWHEVADKVAAVGEAQTLGQRIGEHYSKCRNPTCYWPKENPTGWCEPGFFVAIIETLFREFDNPDVKVLVDWWKGMEEGKLREDLRYVAFASSYNCLLASSLALKQQLVDPYARS